MKRTQLLRAAAFLCLLVLALTAASALFFPKSNQDLYEYHAGGVFGEPENSLDYIFVGDSNVAEGFSPLDVFHETGAAGYACAEPWQTLCGCYHMLKNIFEVQHPSLVLLDTDSFFFSKQGTKAGDATLETILQAYFPIFRYHNNWKTATTASLLQQPDFSWQHEWKGHTVSETVQAAADANYMENRRLPAKQVPLLLRFYLEKIQALCEKNGASLLIVSIPSASTWSDAAHDAVETLAAAKKIPYLDLNDYQEDIGIDWDTDTRDGGTHLNAYGAEKISRYLTQYLEDSCSLPDHRGDAAYADWETAFQNYQAALTK